MAHRFSRDPAEADGWERSELPILCQSCLGDNPYMRMSKSDYDKECKTCAEPFTVFWWKATRDGKYKKTLICQTCTKENNVCQVCFRNLDYGLPVQARDTALSIRSDESIPRSYVNREYYSEEYVRRESIPRSYVNREYYSEEYDRRERTGIDYRSSYGKAPPSETVPRQQRTAPYYKRNRDTPCSFYARGRCNRGAECAYRHDEIPLKRELSRQNIKDRYYGYNDPVAEKLVRRAGEMPSRRQETTYTDLRPSPLSRTYYPSMDIQRMGALVPSQEGSNNRRSGSSDSQQRTNCPSQNLSPPTQRNYSSYHPPYVPSPPTYQQFPPHRTGLQSVSPPATYQQFPPHRTGLQSVSPPDMRAQIHRTESPK